ncbi:hypothetical protein R3P38DRAFT_2932645 [Favolaschia claudopus]|uniref:Uncharacterized protein n=1 Tax=Favolaschia claudopus TaxID=2862362 RepID=A0AAW0BSZ1_9AGAR
MFALLAFSIALSGSPYLARCSSILAQGTNPHFTWPLISSRVDLVSSGLRRLSNRRSESSLQVRTKFKLMMLNGHNDSYCNCYMMSESPNLSLSNLISTYIQYQYQRTTPAPDTIHVEESSISGHRRPGMSCPYSSAALLRRQSFPNCSARAKPKPRRVVSSPTGPEPAVPRISKSLCARFLERLYAVRLSLRAVIVFPSSS